MIFRTIMHDHATSCIAHERLRVEYGLVRKSCMNHARTCKNFFLGRVLRLGEANTPSQKNSAEIHGVGANVRWQSGCGVEIWEYGTLEWLSWPSLGINNAMYTKKKKKKVHNKNKKTRSPQGGLNS